MSDKIENIDIEETNDEDVYVKYCSLCRRSENEKNKIFKFPGGFYICGDCLQKSLDDIDKTYGGVGMPNMPMGNFNISGNNLSPAQLDELCRMMGIPNNTQNIVSSDSNESQDSEGDDVSVVDDRNDNNGSNISNISMINLSDLSSMMGGRNKVKRKSKKNKSKPVIDIEKIPAPHIIKQKLDEYVVGQEHAKKVMSVAVYNHYKRITADQNDEDLIEKSNMLMLGPTGCGKTYLVKTLAKLLDVPLAITDATTLTEAGYIGDDIESVVSKLIDAADGDIEKAEVGIIFIDEIDKLAKKTSTSTRDVNGESVQQGLLKLLEGSLVEVPIGSSSKNAMVPMETVDTRNILFICGGAFPDMENIIKERLNKQSSMGFQADLKDKYDDEKDLLMKVTVEDVRTYGMIPEFIGRLPIVFALSGMTEDMLVSVLKEPKGAITKQYQKLLLLDEVDLQFDDEALHAIARRAIKRSTGARALRAVIEEIMLDIMYEIPKDDNIGRVIITKEYVEDKGAPIIEMRNVK